MTIRRVRTVQAHYVPSTVHYADGPRFEVQEIQYTAPPTVEDSEPFPPGATCLNGMQGVPLFECDRCGESVAESEFDLHRC